MIKLKPLEEANNDNQLLPRKLATALKISLIDTFLTKKTLLIKNKVLQPKVIYILTYLSKAFEISKATTLLSQKKWMLLFHVSVSNAIGSTVLTTIKQGIILQIFHLLMIEYGLHYLSQIRANGYGSIISRDRAVAFFGNWLNVCNFPT